eukprot:8017410-Ditylum_brightwellii.AAC.1
MHYIPFVWGIGYALVMVLTHQRATVAFATITTTNSTAIEREHVTTKSASTSVPTKCDVPVIHPTIAQDTAVKILGAPYSAEEKAAKWFIKWVSKFFVGGCGLPCQAFIQFLFAPHPPNMIMSVDCWKLPNQTDVPRTAPYNSNEYPILGDTLVTLDVDSDNAEHRREMCNVIANKTRQEFWD